MEYFDIVNQNGEATGEVVERKRAHREGYWHHTSHVWIVRKKEAHIQILLQMRCAEKDSFPCCYDISSAGHIPAGDNYIDSAIRELKEELNVEILPEALVDCGLYTSSVDAEFHGEPFVDRQISKVYLLWLDKEEEDFQVQKEEIDHVKWFDFEECVEAVKQNTIPNCILPGELELLKQYL